MKVVAGGGRQPIFPGADGDPDRLTGIERVVQRFAVSHGISSILTVPRSKYRKDRRVYQLGDRYVAKLFAPESRDCYQRERTFFEVNIGSARRPDLVEASFDPELGGHIVMTRLAGEALSDIHQDLTTTDYACLAADLGACIAAIHAVPLTSGFALPSSLDAKRRQYFEVFPTSLDRLARANFLERAALPRLLDVVEACRDRAFASPRRLIHGDLSQWNLFVTELRGRRSCAVVDFEESGPGPLELDFVSPFLFVLDEAFPGRRLAGSWDTIWQNFVNGYASITGVKPDQQLIVAHALTWCFGVTADCMDSEEPPTPQLSRYALSAFATLDGA